MSRPRRRLLQGIAPVRKNEHDELLTDLLRARETLTGWADRLAATPGRDAYWAQRELDLSSARLSSAITAVSVVLAKHEPPELDDEATS